MMTKIYAVLIAVWVIALLSTNAQAQAQTSSVTLSTGQVIEIPKGQRVLFAFVPEESEKPDFCLNIDFIEFVEPTDAECNPSDLVVSPGVPCDD